MTRIKDTFENFKQQGKKVFIPFLMAGDPSLELTKELVLEAQKQGAAMIELGIPYVRPLADGPTIQKAAKRSLKHQTNLKDIFNLVEELREITEIPIILMGYYNLIFNYGLENFVDSCETVGVDGVIIPDLPLGEDSELREHTSKLDVISLISSSSPKERVKLVAQESQGFIYAVSTPGLTGARAKLSRKIEGTINKIKELTDTPVAVGFGISKAEHVKEIAEFADGVIVGSAIIKVIEGNLDLLAGKKEELIKEVGAFISKLTSPLK
jgi:tryptophan synthase alpha chain